MAQESQKKDTCIQELKAALTNMVALVDAKSAQTKQGRAKLIEAYGEFKIFSEKLKQTIVDQCDMRVDRHEKLVALRLANASAVSLKEKMP